VIGHAAFPDLISIGLGICVDLKNHQALPIDTAHFDNKGTR